MVISAPTDRASAEFRIAGSSRSGKVTAINGNHNQHFSGTLYAELVERSGASAAWYASTILTGDGVENLSVDGTNGGSIRNFSPLEYLRRCWIKGVRSLFANRAHVTLGSVSHSTVEDSYFYQNNSHLSVSYGIEYSGASDSVVQNNIVQQVTDSSPSNTKQRRRKCFLPYNFATDTYTDPMARDQLLLACGRRCL